jgi:hypothetical protein
MPLEAHADEGENYNEKMIYSDGRRGFLGNNEFRDVAEKIMSPAAICKSRIQ